jgi:ubiquinone/menaquinone biosynthesis C-methylase UbiE
MDAAIHRSAKAEGGEPVSRFPSADTESAQVWRRGRQVTSSASTHLVPVEEGYERWAPIYDHSPNPLLGREERYLLPLLPSVAGKHVIDLACGTGRWLDKLLQRGVRSAVGVDRSAAMLRVANNNSAVEGRRLTRADCLRLPFRASVFDFAICSFALGHVPDLRGMVRELARVMKPHSDVFVSDLHPDAYARGWRTAFRDATSAVEIDARPYSAEHVMRAFYAGGFECLSHVALCLGEAERPIFARAEKVHIFGEACRVPAVLICRFRRFGVMSQPSRTQ